MLRLRIILLIVLPTLIVVLLGGWGCEEKLTESKAPVDHGIRFYAIGGDSQPCDSMDTVDSRMAVQLDSGDNLPLKAVALTFQRVEGYGQTVAKPNGEAGTNEVKVETDLLGRAYVSFQSFTTCESKVLVTVDTMPQFQLEFVINPGVPCNFPASPGER